MSERLTFSPLWHRVRALKPRLRPHVQVTRQHYRGRRWHVVHDPASNQFYRLSPVAYEMVGLLDGNRTVEEVWNISLGNHGDAAPTQGEAIELLGQMYNANLLAVDITPETEQLLSRGRERLRKRVQQQAIGLMYFKVRLFNPDRYLSWLEPILRPLLNRWGFMLWAVGIAMALYQVLPYWGELAAGFHDAIAPANWFWMMAVFVVLKAIHETGHGVICKRFGGQVPEFGVMLLVLLPAPYVDASSTWAFPSKWRRMAVGAGGMIFELAVAAIAATVWVATLNSGASLIHQLAFNAMFTASISTVIFNANPLMRFDGYYILSDLLEVPNLMQRSMKMLQHVAQKHIYRIQQTRAPSTSRSEQTTLAVYGLLAMIYRIVLFFSITLYIIGQLFAIGLFLAVWTAAAWFIIPVGKFAHWLASSPQLDDSRPRAILTSLVLIAATAGGVGLIPFPDHRRASGVVESLTRMAVPVMTDGLVLRAHVRAGDRVKAGDPILTCANPEMAASLEVARQRLAEYESYERQYTKLDPGAAEVARDKLRGQRELIAALQRRIDGLVIRAPADGVVVPGATGHDPQSLPGAYVHRGQILCLVVDPDRTRIAATLTTIQAAPLMDHAADLRKVEIRRFSDPYDAIPGRGVRVEDAGQRVIRHAALGAKGGGTVELDPQDRSGLSTKNYQFTVYVDADGLGPPGERVRLRFTLPPRPLLEQWIDRLQRMIQGRVNI